MTSSTFDNVLLRRQIGEKRHHNSIKTLYGHKQWVDDLDIVNELGGHTGCVNALSWSKSGRLLASGSDDTHLNIWSYNPDSQAKPFSLNTSVSTGHTQNIFSVKFMPHSNDRTVITAAGDSQVRVFDIEQGGLGGRPTPDSGFMASTRSRLFNSFFNNARFLNEANTNTRVYRSHADRVKRIVTESSPHWFLTCSEDGEVRQWDLREPSSAYPSPLGGGRYGSRSLSGQEDEDDVPPPLISYKKYSLDLNSITCSGSQPQYIALGGAHLHCFLHDRRMLGRDVTLERGQTSGATSTLGNDMEMDEATRCVRRFAPSERRRMGPHDNGHITACKISDANPNEMIASWSGDHIYSFDLVKSPDAREAEGRQERIYHVAQGKLKDEKDRKRKRAKASASSTSLRDSATVRRRLRQVTDDPRDENQTALRVQFGNGQTENVPINTDGGEVTPRIQARYDTLLTEAQKLSERVAKSLVRLRKTIFDFSAATYEVADMEGSSELTPHTLVFTDVLGQAAILLTEMDAVIRDWSYPMDPSPEDVTLQQTLRRNRQASWRFVQASGCLARTLGASLQTLSPTEDPRTALFEKVRPAAREGRAIDDSSRFCYDFLKAILLWLDGGPTCVVEGFQRPPEQSNESQRFPLDSEDGIGIEDSLNRVSAYLSNLSSTEKPVVDLDANSFERDDLRNTFATQRIAVDAFFRAVRGIQLSTNESSETQPAKKTVPQTMNKGSACRFWGVKVGRSLLMEAGEGVNFGFTNQAFGGLRLHVRNRDEHEHERFQQNGDLVEREGPVEPVDSVGPAEFIEQEDEDDDDDDEDDDEDGNERSEDDEEQSNNDEDGEEEQFSHPLFRRRAAFGRSRERALVNNNVPYSSHTRTYKGHCNTKTVKDVNFYGLNDEYVISGSDSGHFFIWDRQTTEVVNILEGDGEVVNVAQGHPYEPMIAVSGIDSTVKIFGSGGRERHDAENGVNIANPGGGRHSSLRMGGRRRRHATLEEETEDEATVAARGLASRKAMHKSYEIMSQNDLDRRSGVGDAFITRGMLARLAAHINQGQLAGAALGDGAGGAVVIDENCTIM